MRPLHANKTSTDLCYQSKPAPFYVHHLQPCRESSAIIPEWGKTYSSHAFLKPNEKQCSAVVTALGLSWIKICIWLSYGEIVGSWLPSSSLSSENRGYGCQLYIEMCKSWVLQLFVCGMHILNTINSITNHINPWTLTFINTAWNYIQCQGVKVLQEP